MMEDFFGYAMSVRLDKTTESWRVSQFSFHVRMFMSFGHDLGFIWNPWVHGPYDSGVVPLRNCAPAWAEGPVFLVYGLASHHAIGMLKPSSIIWKVVSSSMVLGNTMTSEHFLFHLTMRRFDTHMV